MARGRRASLAELANAVGEHSPVERLAPTSSPVAAPLSELTANPRNPRDDLGDLEELASIKDIQLQPAVVISKGAYLRLYPEDRIDTRWVVVNGCRRLAAAHRYGRTDLEIVVKEDVARDRITLMTCAISENVDRRDFDVLEEAKAVEALVGECGTAFHAAERLKKTEGWVSQRRALLNLAPELQAALRAGELAVREARSLARVPKEKQVAAWQAALDKEAANAGEGHAPRENDGAAKSPTTTHITKALRTFDSQPDKLASALVEYLGVQGVQTLLAALTTATAAK